MIPTLLALLCKWDFRLEYILYMGQLEPYSTSRYMMVPMVAEILIWNMDILGRRLPLGGTGLSR